MPDNTNIYINTRHAKTVTSAQGVLKRLLNIQTTRQRASHQC